MCQQLLKNYKKRASSVQVPQVIVHTKAEQKRLIYLRGISPTVQGGVRVFGTHIHKTRSHTRCDVPVYVEWTYG